MRCIQSCSYSYLIELMLRDKEKKVWKYQNKSTLIADLHNPLVYTTCPYRPEQHLHRASGYLREKQNTHTEEFIIVQKLSLKIDTMKGFIPNFIHVNID